MHVTGKLILAVTFIFGSRNAMATDEAMNTVVERDGTKF